MKTTQRRVLVLSLVAMAALALAPMTSAHGGNHGTIKVHDEEDADPDMRNEPHVGCEFFVEGFNMHGDAGELVFYGWPPTGNKTEVMRADWNGTLEEDGDGFHFLAGPFSLPSGHYRVEAFSDAGHPGDHEHFAKSKTFWVHCGDEAPECPPTELTAKANEDGSILVSWETTTMVNLYRAEGGGGFEYVGTFEGIDSYLDTETTVGTTYTYAVTSFDGETESEICALVEATAIPVFPGMVAATLAIAGGALAYASLRRR